MRVRHGNPLAYPCPKCGAGVGQRCFGPHGVRVGVHLARRRLTDPGSAPAARVVAQPVNGTDVSLDPRVVLDRGRCQGLTVAASIVARVLDSHPDGMPIPEIQVRKLYIALLEAADRYDPDSE